MSEERGGFAAIPISVSLNGVPITTESMITLFKECDVQQLEAVRKAIEYLVDQKLSGKLSVKAGFKF